MNKVQIIVFIIFFIFLGFWFYTISQEKMEDFYYAQLIHSVGRRNKIVPAEPRRPKLEVKGESAISVRITPTGKERIIFSKNINDGLPIASLTKLMTGIVALENYDQEDYNLDTSVTISRKAANQQNAYWGGNLRANETKTIRDLLELMLVYSSNDSAFTLSELDGQKNFVKKMNKKAEKINLENTHFINASGLDPENSKLPNYSTAKDLVKLTKYILKNHPSIFEISLKSGDCKLNNSLSSLYLNEGEQLIGGKTGYTKKAGGCLLTVFKNEKNDTYINIVLGTESYKERIEEMQKIINWINLQ